MLQFSPADYGFQAQRILSCSTSPYVAMGFLEDRGMNPEYLTIRSGTSIRHVGDRGYVEITAIYIYFEPRRVWSTTETNLYYLDLANSKRLVASLFFHRGCPNKFQGVQ
jgi:hypothetical protein